MITIDDLRARFEASADPVLRNSLRCRGRNAAQRAGVAVPAWCARLRASKPAPLTAPIAEQTGLLECPRYDSLRAWARVGCGARVVCWHPQADGAMHVSLVVIATDADRKRSPTYASEADALDALATGTVRWASPSKAARRVSPFQF